jgi:hypothetical protein
MGVEILEPRVVRQIGQAELIDEIEIEGGVARKDADVRLVVVDAEDQELAVAARLAQVEGVPRLTRLVGEPDELGAQPRVGPPEVGLRLGELADAGHLRLRRLRIFSEAVAPLPAAREAREGEVELQEGSERRRDLHHQLRLESIERGGAGSGEAFARLRWTRGPAARSSALS